MKYLAVIRLKINIVQFKSRLINSSLLVDGNLHNFILDEIKTGIIPSPLKKDSQNVFALQVLYCLICCMCSLSTVFLNGEYLYFCI